MENKSPSSRRAWIEIYAHPDYKGICRVALLAEGVGRNITLTYDDDHVPGRPPRGGRG